MQDLERLTQASKSVLNFSNLLRVTEKPCTCRLVLEGKADRKVPETSRQEFQGKISANDFALLNEEVLPQNN